MLYTIAVILLILAARVRERLYDRRVDPRLVGCRDRVVSGWVAERPTRRVIAMTA